MIVAQPCILAAFSAEHNEMRVFEDDALFSLLKVRDSGDFCVLLSRSVPVAEAQDFWDEMKMVRRVDEHTPIIHPQRRKDYITSWKLHRQFRLSYADRDRGVICCRAPISSRNSVELSVKFKARADVSFEEDMEFMFDVLVFLIKNSVGELCDATLKRLKESSKAVAHLKRQEDEKAAEAWKEKESTRLEAQAKAMAQAEAQAKAQAEAQAKAKAEAEAQAKAEVEAQAKAELEAQAKASETQKAERKRIDKENVSVPTIGEIRLGSTSKPAPVANRRNEMIGLQIEAIFPGASEYETASEDAFHSGEESDSESSGPIQHRSAKTTMKFSDRLRDDKKHKFLLKGSSTLVGRTAGDNSVVEVYRPAPERVGVLEHVADISSAPTVDKAILAHDCTKLLATSTQDANKVQQVDLETGEVVSSWRTPHARVTQISTTFTGAQHTNDPTFLTMNQGAIMKHDTRLGTNRSMVAEINYATDVKFSCIGVTTEGHIAMGSADGGIRLYDGHTNDQQKYKRAKNYLRQVQEPITGMSAWGSFVLATTDTYLVFIDVTDPTHGRNGFTSTIRLHSRPQHVQLTITNEDCRRLAMDSIRFRKAHFSEDGRRVVSVTGNVVVTWTIRDILLGRQTKYTLHVAPDIVREVDNDVCVTDADVRLIDGRKKRLSYLS